MQRAYPTCLRVNSSDISTMMQGKRSDMQEFGCFQVLLLRRAGARTPGLAAAGVEGVACGGEGGKLQMLRREAGG